MSDFKQCSCTDLKFCVGDAGCRRERMEAFKLRVHTGKAALDEKRGKLEHFMLQPAFLDLPQAERNRLMRQAVAMEQYSQVLFERLEADFQ